MALDQSDLKTQIKSAMEAARAANPEDPDAALDAFADALATAIHNYTSAATVRVTAQVGEIAVSGTPAAQQNLFPILLSGELE